MVLVVDRQAHRQSVAQRNVDRALGVDGVVRAAGRLGIAAGLADLRALGVDEDGAAGRVGADEGALRTAQHFHIGDIVIGPRRDDGRLEHAIHIGGDAIGRIGRAAGQTDAADIDALGQAGVFHAEGRGGELQVFQALDALVRQPVAGQRRHRDRHSLDVFRPLLRRDHDFAESLGACRRLLRGGGAAHRRRRSGRHQAGAGEDRSHCFLPRNFRF